MKILLVEDDEKINSFIKKGLKEQGFVVDNCDNGDTGFFLASSNAYNVILLDIMLPGRDGLSILKNLREDHNNTPVILLTARSALNERIEGLNSGADDYLCKPFFIEELIARIHAICRRTTEDAANIIQFKEMCVNMLTREVKIGSKLINLTAREFNLLSLMLRSPGRVYTRTQIIEHVWGYDFDPQTNVVDVYIRRLRNKMAEVSNEPMINTVRGVGYRMAVNLED